MNPSSNESAGLSLPPPVNEQLPTAPAPHETSQAMPEQANDAIEQATITTSSATAAPPMMPISLANPQPANSTTSDVSKTTNTTSASITDDGDLIEKEWVNKAKHIVEANREDPYKQSEELTEVKADYLKKRYDKSIKLNK